MNETTATAPEQAQHTPGPWTSPGYMGGGNKQSCTVCAHGEVVAHVFQGFNKIGDGEGNALENAHLVAAAPDLLDAAKFAFIALNNVRPIGKVIGGLAALEHLGQAIAKAEGRSA